MLRDLSLQLAIPVTFQLSPSIIQNQINRQESVYNWSIRSCESKNIRKASTLIIYTLSCLESF